MEDPIKQLLEQTGWSVSQILEKLQSYRNNNCATELQNQEKKNGKENEETNKETGQLPNGHIQKEAVNNDSEKNDIIIIDESDKPEKEGKQCTEEKSETLSSTHSESNDVIIIDDNESCQVVDLLTDEECEFVKEYIRNKSDLGSEQQKCVNSNEQTFGANSEEVIVEVKVDSDPESLYAKYIYFLYQQIIRKYIKLSIKMRNREYKNKPKETTLDDVHMKIKKQLQLLRTRRKAADLTDGFLTQSNGLNLSSMLKSNTEMYKIDLGCSIEPLVGSNNVVITNVIGGYTSDDDTDNNLITSNSKSKVIVPTKTTNITKIKGWKRKRFASKKSSLVSSLDLKIRESSKASLNNTKTSGFITDGLEDYFTENSDLHLNDKALTSNSGNSLKHTYIDFKLPEISEGDVTFSSSRVLENKYTMNASQRRKYEKTMQQMHEKLIKGDVSFTRRCFLASSDCTRSNTYVLYNGKRIKVASGSKKTYLANIKEKRKYKKTLLHKNKNRREVLETSSFKKPSLLHDLKKDRKTFMLNENEWKHMKVKLPKVTLEVKPEIGRPINPSIEHLIANESTTLDSDRVSFALSVLHAKECPSNEQFFSFPIKYKNAQVYMDIFKSNAVNNKLTRRIVAQETDKEIEDSINDVMNGLLNYIDTLENTWDIYINPEIVQTAITSSPQQVCETNSKKRKGVFNEVKNMKKTTLEMKRLNCKIVSMSEDEDNGNKLCHNDFCKLGCVCNSIRCNPVNLLNTHCGLPDCMFECLCQNVNQDIKKNCFLLGEDVFSESAMSRIEDAAKKNLAKEEKEFTQTAIRTNDQIIILGDTRERKRRIIKAPKKFDDFVEDITYHNYNLEKAAVQLLYREEKWNREAHITNHCSVRLTRYNFDDIIPYCMVHNLYKCHCKGKFVNISENLNIVSCKNVFSSNLSPNRLISTTGKSFDKEKYSSRTRGLPTSYYLIRNKSQYHKKNIRKSCDKLQKLHDIHKRRALYENLRKPWTDMLDIYNFEPKAPSLEQDLISSTQGIDSASNTSNSLMELSTNNINCSNELNDQMKTNNKFLSLMNKPQTSFRLISWTELLTKFENGLYQLWYSNIGKVGPIIVTGDGERPSTHHYNIKLFQQTKSDIVIPSNIIRWLITKTTPLNKSPEVISVVLNHNKHGNWEICCVCEEVCSSSDTSKKKLRLSMIENWNSTVDLTTTEETNNFNRKTSIKTEIESGNMAKRRKGTVDVKKNEIVPENYPYVESSLECFRKQFQIKKLIIEPSACRSSKVDRILWAHLPPIYTENRWRVINLDVPFTFLLMARCKCTIRQEDILKAVNVANTYKKTIVLKSAKLENHYLHRKFGIYCSHNHNDKIFVGPYSVLEEPNLDALSLINNVYVNTALFNQMHGKEGFHTGYWFYQVPLNTRKSIPTNDNVSTVDLTIDNDNDDKIDVSDTSENPIISENTSKEVAKVNKRKDTEIRRLHLKRFAHLDGFKSNVKFIKYIETNIPRLGYVVTYKQDKCDITYVSLLKKQGERYNTPNEAVDAIKTLILKYCILLPKSFPFQIELRDKASIHLQMEFKIFNGYHVIGEFGYFNTMYATEKDFESLGFSKEDYETITQEQEDRMLLNFTFNVAKMLNVEVDKSNNEEALEKVLKKTQAEITKLKEEEVTHVEKKTELQRNKALLIGRCIELQSKLSRWLKEEAEVKLDEIVNPCKNQVKSNSEDLDQPKGLLSNLDYKKDNLVKDFEPIPVSKKNLRNILCSPVKTVINGKVVELGKIPIDCDIQKLISNSSNNYGIDVNITTENSASTSNDTKTNGNQDVEPNKMGKNKLIKDFPLKVKKEVVDILKQRQKNLTENNSVVDLHKDGGIRLNKDILPMKNNLYQLVNKKCRLVLPRIIKNRKLPVMGKSNSDTISANSSTTSTSENTISKKNMVLSKYWASKKHIKVVPLSKRTFDTKTTPVLNLGKHVKLLNPKQYHIIRKRSNLSVNQGITTTSSLPIITRLNPTLVTVATSLTSTTTSITNTTTHTCPALGNNTLPKSVLVNTDTRSSLPIITRMNPTLVTVSTPLTGTANSITNTTAPTSTALVKNTLSKPILVDPNKHFVLKSCDYVNYYQLLPSRNPQSKVNAVEVITKSVTTTAVESLCKNVVTPSLVIDQIPKTDK